MCSARWKRMAQPRGFALGSLSGISGTPVEFEKRIVTGVDALFMCAARVRVAATDEGVKVPVSMAPLAWAGRKPGWSPKIVSKAWTMSLLSARIFSSVGSGMEGLLFRNDFAGSDLPRSTVLNAMDSRKVRRDCEICKQAVC